MRRSAATALTWPTWSSATTVQVSCRSTGPTRGPTSTGDALLVSHGEEGPERQF